MSLTKADLAISLVEELGLNKNDAKALVDSFFEEIAAALARGENLTIPGLGKFVLKDKNARPGRNLKTGEKVIISPRRVVTFKQGEKLKEIISK